MKLTAVRTVMHGVSPLQTSRYSEEFIAQQNKEHDRRMGWSQDFPTLYLNVDRHPETFRGKVSELWSNK